jgi:hypothetical protein
LLKFYNSAMDAWLSDVRDAVAEATGLPASELEIDEEAARELLSLARIAAHESGERINAPLLTYLVGIAVGRGADLDEVVAAATSSH